MSKEPEFAVFPLDWVRHPKCRKLRQADPANPDRWWVLMTLATTCRAGGRLVASDGTPLTAEDFAWEHDRLDQAWAEFIDLAKKLKLLGVDQDGTLYVVPWHSWNRDAAKAKALKDDKYRKRAERAEAKTEALEQELARLRGDLSEPVQTCPKSVPPVQLEEKREDLTRYEKTQIVRSERESRLCLTDFSEKDFFREAGEVHRAIKDRPLSGPDRTALRKSVAEWEGYSWGDKAAALWIGADCVQQKIEDGRLEAEGNSWFYAVRVAENQLEQAADINATNRIAPELGEALIPIRWDGS